VRKLAIQEEIETAPSKKLSHEARKNRDKAVHMNPGYVLFLSAALLVAGFVLIGYIKLQSEITASVKDVAALESQLNELKLSNDEEYSRITRSVDLEEIKRIAIQELGMRYAEKDQIVTIPGEGSDYVTQLEDIPK
jgi:hypothetical protein